MSDSFITRTQVDKWFEDLDETLKNQIVHTTLNEHSSREEYYSLYQAAQLLKTRFLQDFYEEVEFVDPSYDPDTNP